VKVGFDPSAPDIHLGHTVVMRKMRHFQNLGNRVIFLIGDFTGLIGDPSGRKTTRPQLSREEIMENAETYKRQAFKILDPEKTIIDFNSRWLGALGSEGWIRLSGKITLARILERDDFTKRFKANEPIFMHELLYPLAQGYDSVFLKADVEMGGTDQLFNLLVGRNLMREYGLEPQIVLTLPLLEGLDGKEKMSKSLNNYIAVEDPPAEMFGKVMSIPDSLMWKYFTLLTDLAPQEIEEIKKRVERGDLHPRESKVDLGKRIVTDFHGKKEALRAHEEFERIFHDRLEPTEIPSYTLPAQSILLSKLLKELDLSPSNAESRRFIQQGAVTIDGSRVSDDSLVIDPKEGDFMTIKVGKRRWAQVTFVRKS